MGVRPAGSAVQTQCVRSGLRSGGDVGGKEGLRGLGSHRWGLVPHPPAHGEPLEGGEQQQEVGSVAAGQQPAWLRWAHDGRAEVTNKEVNGGRNDRFGVESRHDIDRTSQGCAWRCRFWPERVGVHGTVL